MQFFKSNCSLLIKWLIVHMNIQGTLIRNNQYVTHVLNCYIYDLSNYNLC